MANAKNSNKPNQSSRDDPDLGSVRIRSAPTPDTQDRLRRLFALLVRYATADGEQTKSTREDDSEAAEK